MEKFRPYNNSNINNNINIQKTTVHYNAQDSIRQSKQQLASIQQRLYKNNNQSSPSSFQQRKFSNYQSSQPEFSQKNSNQNYYNSNQNNLQNYSKNLINKEIDLLKQKFQNLQSKSTRISQQLNYQKSLKLNFQKQAQAKNSQKSKEFHSYSELQFKTLETLEKKIQIIVKEVAISIKNITNQIKTKFNDRQGRNQKMHDNLKKIKIFYQTNLQNIEKRHKLQMNDISQEIKKKEQMFLSRIQSIQSKKNQMMAQYGKRQTEYLNRIFALQQKLKNVNQKNNTLAMIQPKPKRKSNLSLASANLEYVLIGSFASSNKKRILQPNDFQSINQNNDKILEQLKGNNRILNSSFERMSERKPQIVLLKQRSQQQQLSFYKMDPIQKKNSDQSYDSLADYSSFISNTKKISNLSRDSNYSNNNQNNFLNNNYNKNYQSKKSVELEYSSSDIFAKANPDESLTLNPFSVSKRLQNQTANTQTNLTIKSLNNEIFIPLDNSKTINNNQRSLYKGNNTGRNWQKFSDDENQSDHDQFY